MVLYKWMDFEFQAFLYLYIFVKEKLRCWDNMRTSWKATTTWKK